MRKRRFVIKANGSRVPFNEDKVKATCIRAGASRKLAENIAKRIRDNLHPTITTKEIYRMVLRELLLSDGGKIISHRYRLKEAIMKMGPMGFPFEVYVSKLLLKEGYLVEGTRKIIKGECVHHEIDIICINNKSKSKTLVECKHHNSAGRFTGLKESLYTHARFLDLSSSFQEEMLVCNTKISDEAIAYSNCVGQKTIGWRYPALGGLEKMVEENGLYPITIFELKISEIQKFAKHNIMTIQDLIDYDLFKFSKKTGIQFGRLKRLQNFATDILKNQKPFLTSRS